MESKNVDASTRRRMYSETDQKNNHIEQEVNLKRELNLLGGIALIVATTVGAGIFITPNGVLHVTNSIGLSLVIWLCSGIIAILGGLCYCELGTLVTKSGGEFAYIMEAFGPIPAFLFSWTSVFIARPIAVAVTCLSFAEYMARLFPYCGFANAPVTIIAILTISTIMILNSYSVAMSVKFNILFSAITCGALAVIIIGGIVHIAQGNTQHFENSFEGSAVHPSDLALALYQALWAYGGWNYLNYATEEIKNPNKNLPRAIVLSILLITALYVLTNISYFAVLTKDEMLFARTVAVTWSDRILGKATILLPISVLMCTFGAANGLVFGSGRLVFAAGREGHLPEVLSFVHVHYFTPLPSVVFTAEAFHSEVAFGITLVLTNCLVAMVMVGISDIPNLVDIFSFSSWLFYAAAAAALLVMRYTKREVKRVIKVPTIIPVVFLCLSVYLVIGPIIENPQMKFLYAILFVFSGLIFYFPLVHFKLVSLDRVTVLFQLLFQVSPSRQISEN